MSAITDVCNRALSMVGARSTIASLTENSPEAKACNLWFTDVRRDTLRAAHWRFAEKATTLSLLKARPGTAENPTAGSPVWTPDTPPPPWLYEYSYPADCLQARRISPQSSREITLFPTIPYNSVASGYYVRFTIATDDALPSGEQKVILTNASQAILYYTRDISDPTLWDSHFEGAVTMALAASISLTLTGDKGIRDRLYASANAMIIEARVSNANESLTIQDHVPDWIVARTGSWGTNDTTYAFPYGPLFGG
jgi:hypothetical protein